MSVAAVSALALLVAIAVSMVSRINVGLIGIGLAWLVGVYVAGMSAEQIMTGFPVSLFLTLCGVTWLFGIAEVNGSIQAVAQRAAALLRGQVWLLPPVLFALACLLSGVGPGAITSVALLIPIALALGARAQVPPMLTALMVANGANAGNLSPVSAVGIVANTRMAEIGLGGNETLVLAANFLAHLLLALLAYGYFVRQIPAVQVISPAADSAEVAMNRARALTIAVIGLWVVAVLWLKISIGLSAFAATLLLIALRAADEGAALRKVPLGIILMVCGVATLIALLEKNGGLALFSSWIAGVATPGSINGVIAFVTGLISTYSSTSGVVLPAFLPMVPSLVAETGGGDPLAVALSINVGSALVDVSPLSTIGALCIAAVADPAAAKTLFYQLLAWGLAMTLVGAALAQWLIPLLIRVI